MFVQECKLLPLLMIVCLQAAGATHVVTCSNLCNYPIITAAGAVPVMAEYADVPAGVQNAATGL